MQWLRNPWARAMVLHPLVSAVALVIVEVTTTYRTDHSSPALQLSAIALSVVATVAMTMRRADSTARERAAIALTGLAFTLVTCAVAVFVLFLVEQTFFCANGYGCLE